jgi:hypothetical protein
MELFQKFTIMKDIINGWMDNLEPLDLFLIKWKFILFFTIKMLTQGKLWIEHTTLCGLPKLT